MLNNKIFQKLTSRAKHSLEESAIIAKYRQSQFIEPEHILLAIFLERGSLGSTILHDIGIKSANFEIKSTTHNKTQKKPTKEKAVLKNKNLSEATKGIIVYAYNTANKLKYPYVGTEHLIFAIMKKPTKETSKILNKRQHKKIVKNSSVKSFNKNKKVVKTVENKLVIPMDFNKDILDILNFPGIAQMKSLVNNSQPLNSSTPHLDYFCTNLNAESVKQKNITIGRKKEITKIIHILGRKNKNNPLLIGNPGVGKTAIIEGLAKKIAQQNVPRHLLEKRILSLDMASVVAGTTYRGEFEQRLKDIVQEARQDKNVILFIDEIHNIVGAGNASGGLDAANILKPILARGEISFIGATTLNEYKEYLEKDSALERRFQVVAISEPNETETKKILAGIKPSYEKFHNVSITTPAIESAVVLSSRYITDRFQPDKAIDLIDETAASLRSQKNPVDNLWQKLKNTKDELTAILQEKSQLANEEIYDTALILRDKEEHLLAKMKALQTEIKLLEKNNLLKITAKDIATTISQNTGVPLEKIISQPGRQTKSLFQNLNNKIIGQEDALKKIVSAINRSHSGVSSANRPIGSFLFLGPSGVGKTLTAKILTDILFTNKEALIRIDMSEFMERHSVSQLLGAPAGYVGYGKGGKLTESVRRQPYSLILFDEIEKAHPDVFNILLQILEEGELTDAEGTLINFKNTLIILTSNIGTQEFTKVASIGFTSSNKAKNKQTSQEKFTLIKERVLQELRSKIKPEILNRLDHTVVFNALTKKDIRQIIQLELKILKGRLAKQNYNLIISPKIITFLVNKNFNHASQNSNQQGARQIRKNIQHYIENKIADEIISNSQKNKKISLNIKDNKIIIF